MVYLIGVEILLVLLIQIGAIFSDSNKGWKKILKYKLYYGFFGKIKMLFLNNAKLNWEMNVLWE